MPVPDTADDFLALVRRSGLVQPARLDAYAARTGELTPVPSAARFASVLIQDGLLTILQAQQLLRGRWRNFVIAGKYKLLEHLGTGGMGQVFLCEHMRMRRLVALKMLPPANSASPVGLRRFYREARAAAAVDHPNIVRAHDADCDGSLQFLVMEYVDGTSLDAIVRRGGPLSV